MRIGCSPAYCFAHFAEALRYDDLVWAVKRVAALGFAGLQLETYSSSQVQFYTDKHIRELRDMYRDHGLESSQFIMHSAKSGVCSLEEAAWKSALEEVRTLVDVCSRLEIVHTINVPASPPSECVVSYYETYPGATQPKLQLPADHSWQEFWKSYVNHVEQIAELVESANMRLGIEAVPYGLVSNSDSMLRLLESLPQRSVGLILDTGHMHFLRESFGLICDKFAGRIYGTHINDNDGSTDDHNPPGEGTIDWITLLAALQRSGYDGPLDLEINICNNPDNTYLGARRFLEDKMVLVTSRS
jgi:sugar phosphate isomerase/epimerase